MSRVFVSKIFFCVKQEIKGLREELSTRLNSSDTLEIIREKEEQIRGLLEEGKAYLQREQTKTCHLYLNKRIRNPSYINLGVEDCECFKEHSETLYLVTEKMLRHG